MAEKIWTEEKKDAAAAGRYYIKAGPKRGKLYLSGAKLKWKSDPTFTYVPSIRVAGTPAEITQLLVDLGNTEDVAAQYVASGYTAASADSAELAAELADLKAFKAMGSPKKADAAAPKNSIAWYAQKVEEAKVQGAKPKSPKKKAAKKSPKKAKKTKTKSPKKAAKKAKTKTKSPKKAAKKASKKASPKRGPKPLKDKVAALKAGKVMDVTKYRANGEGAKVIDAPSGDRSKKVVVGKIAANAQDGLVGVKAAAKALGKDNLVEQWKAAKVKVLARSPKAKSKSKSPKSKTSPKAKSAKKSSPAAALPLSPSSPRGLPVLNNSPRSPRGSGLPALPVVRPPTIGSPATSPRL